jgi:ActR/RegA family two-component response regulator
MADKKKIKILLVDDEQEFLDSISERMRLRGFEPTCALNGQEAIELAKQEKFHAAVVDLKMPGIDGVVTITKLKEIRPKMKTVLLTGFGSDKVKEATESLDSEYFEKGEISSFWDWLKRLPKKLEDTMAAAGMATHGDLDDARKITEEEDEE